MHNTVKFTIFYIIYIIDGISVNNSKECLNE